VRPPAPAATAAEASLAEASRLADRGEFDAAAALAEGHLERRGPDAEAYYLLGLVRDATGDAAGAETAYRKALYLAAGHARALAHLASLLEMRGEFAEARRLRARVARGGGA
jgi:chemotaxis protein methyltransferase WspC